MKLSKEKQQQLIAVVVGAVVVVVVLYFMVISKQQGHLKALAVHIDATNQMILKAEKDIGAEKEKLQMLSESTNRLAELEQSMMPTNEIYSTFLSTFNRFKADFGPSIENIEIDKEQLHPLRMFRQFPYGTAVFKVRGLAYYHDFGRFLAEFESKFPFFRVQNFSLASGTLLATDPEKLSFSMDIVVLVRPGP